MTEKETEKRGWKNLEDEDDKEVTHSIQSFCPKNVLS